MLKGEGLSPRGRWTDQGLRQGEEKYDATAGQRAFE